MFRKIAEGNVFVNCEKNASGPRTAILDDGSIVCTFMLNSYSGANDFVPMITYSKDGTEWTDAKEVWPTLVGKESLFGSVRKGTDGKYSISGQVFPIACEGENFWSDEVKGMKENSVFLSICDDAKEFPLPEKVDLPYYGSAEQPGGLLTEKDKITMIYAPYPTIEKREEVDNGCIVVLCSTDGGKNFTAKKIGSIEADSQYAESWITRLSDGRLMISTWQTASENSSQYFISDDDGETFQGPFAQDFRGQSTGISAWHEGSVLIAYNQRKYDTVGVWLAMEKFSEDGKAQLLENEPVWEASTGTRSGTSGNFSQWTDFSFGEPSVSVLPDDSLLVTFWYRQDGMKGIRYVRLVRE